MKVSACVVALLGVWLSTAQAHIALPKFPGQINPGQINPGPINPGPINPGPINPPPINIPYPPIPEQMPYERHDKCEAVEKCSCNCNFGGMPDREHKKEKWSSEWKMVFKAVAGSGRDVHNDFLYGGNINEGVEQAQDITSTMPFRDGSILDSWHRIAVKQVKIEVFAGGVKKAWYLFNGIGSDIESWMSQDNLMASPYEDIKSVSLNYKSVDGHSGLRRRFFLNDNYGGCPNDCGYLVVVDYQSTTKPCAWEREAALPYFVYGNKKDSCSKYQVAGEAGIGDRFVISVKKFDVGPYNL